MKKLIAWIFPKKDPLDVRIQKLMKERQQSERRLETFRRWILKTENQLNDQMMKAKNEINRADGLNKKLEEALNASQEKIQTLEDVVVPGLVAANETFRNTWEAQSAQAVMQSQLRIRES